MRRHLPAAAVVLADTALMVAARPGGVPIWAIVGYAVVAAAVVGLRDRPAAAFALALVLASVSGSGFVLTIWAAYQAGRRVTSRTGFAVVLGAAAGRLAAQVAVAGLDPRVRLVEDLPRTAATFVVFVGLPLLAGGYLAQHERLVRELRGQRHLVAEQERLRERLRIARDMHDSLGHRLSLVSVQAAALEVGELSPGQRRAVQQLARSARGALSELYELVGALRGDPLSRAPGIDGPGIDGPGIDDKRIDAIPGVVEEFRQAGVAVDLQSYGQPRAVTDLSGQAAYRVVQEGLTNASRHAPGQPVTVRLDWEPDALLVTVTNPAASTGGRAGHGLTGLAERLEIAHGFLEHRHDAGTFRLSAVLPTAGDPPPSPRAWALGRRAWALGLATGVLMFVVLPAGLVLGVR